MSSCEQKLSLHLEHFNTHNTLTTVRSVQPAAFFETEPGLKPLLAHPSLLAPETLDLSISPITGLQ